MPVRSLHSPVLRWPDAKTVGRAVRTWAQECGQAHPEVVRIGYFGSYARGDWGVGSDLDLVVVVKQSSVPNERRAIGWNTLNLPVPADVLVYTQVEWTALLAKTRFGEVLTEETVWVYEREEKTEARHS